MPTLARGRGGGGGGEGGGGSKDVCLGGGGGSQSDTIAAGVNSLSLRTLACPFCGLAAAAAASVLLLALEHAATATPDGGGGGGSQAARRLAFLSEVRRRLEAELRSLPGEDEGNRGSALMRDVADMAARLAEQKEVGKGVTAP